MDPIRAFARRLTIIGVLLSGLGSAQAAKVSITGRVNDTSGNPVSSATVTVRDGASVLLRDIVVTFGNLNLTVDTTARALALDLKAKDFLPRTLTIDIGANVVALRPIVMERVEGLELGRITHHVLASSNEETIEVVFSNKSKTTAAHIMSITLVGSKKKETDCFDLATPGLTIKFPDKLRANAGTGIAAITAKPAGGDAQSLSAAGRLEILQCDQRRLHVDIHYELSVPPNKEDKLVLVLPAMTVDRKTEPLALDRWDTVVLEAKLQDGRLSRSSGFRSDSGEHR